MSAFEELGLAPEIIRTVEEENWLLPTPIQAEAIPLILGGGDVCAAAETGSGKTGAFGLPALQIVNEVLRNIAVVSRDKTKVQIQKICLDENDKDAYINLGPDGLECKSFADKKWVGVKANIALLSGKYMFEVELLSEGLVRVGWGLSISLYEIGKDDKSFGYGATAKKSWNGKFEDYGETYTKGDVIGAAIDFNRKIISFYKNGKYLGDAFNIPSYLYDKPLKPAICGKVFHARCHFDNLLYPISEYIPVGKANIEDTTEAYNKDNVQQNNFQRNEKNRVACIILEPTRDLAKQTYECMKSFSKYIDVCRPRIGLFIGGYDEKAQKSAAQDGLDICVGTLLKVVDMIRRRNINLNNLKLLILDEADDLIKNDDKNEILRLKKTAQDIQRGSRVQTLFFSATLHSKEVRAAIEKLTNKPTWVDLKGKPTIPDTVHFVTYMVDPTKDLPFPVVNNAVMPTTDGVHPQINVQVSNKNEFLSRNIKMYKPQILVKIADAFDMRNCLVFCRTNLDCDNLETFLTQLGGGRKFTGKVETGKENPYSCVVLAGMRSSEERMANLEHFKQGDVRFLICTDVAARGIDIAELPYLIMLNIPDETEQFFHRVGRVGRADRMGLAISIVSTCQEKVWYHKCPNRGKGCTNTKLVEQGGCTIWYDEPYYLKTLEERIGKALPVMHSTNFSVKGILDPLGVLAENKPEDDDRRKRHIGGNSNEKKIEAKSGTMLMYGKSRDDQMTAQSNKALQKLLPAVDELKELEKQIQQQYLQVLHSN